MKKISLDPMPRLREVAEARVNSHFNASAAQNAQQDQEHRRKREIAQQVETDGAAMAPFAFAEEARLMGVSVEDLAALVLTKPDTVLERGLARRSVILLIRSATSPAALNLVLENAGIPKPMDI